MQIIFEQLSQVVTQLYDKLENIERLLELKSNESKEETDKLFTIKEAAVFLSLSIFTIYGPTCPWCGTS